MHSWLQNQSTSFFFSLRNPGTGEAVANCSERGGDYLKIKIIVIIIIAFIHVKLIFDSLSYTDKIMMCLLWFSS